MYKFNDLNAGRMLYVSGFRKMEFSILMITSIENINGYLKIECESKYNKGIVLFIPTNHLNADNVRVGNYMIFTRNNKWMKYANNIMCRNAVCSVRFGINYTT